MSSIHKTLVEIQHELKAPKGQYNSFGKYAYRSCEDIIEAVKPLAHARGCTLIIFDEITECGGKVYVKATAQLSDGPNTIEATAFAREAETRKGMDDSQITGATSSYARKYALNGLFAIDDTKDADATNDHKPLPKKKDTGSYQELLRKVVGHEDKATEGMIKKGWISEGQTYEDVAQDKAAEILANDAFFKWLYN